MVKQFRCLGPKFGVRLDHHTNEVLEFFLPLPNKMDSHILQAKSTLKYILFTFESLTKGMLASRKYVIEHTSQAKNVYFLSLMRIFELVVTLVEDNLTW